MNNSFGAAMPGRTYPLADGYRYGFNGKEKDTEIKGDGNSYDFVARLYDPRLGVFLSLDPQQKKYAAQSPYAAFNSNPILFADPTGESGEVTIDKASKTITITSTMIFYGSKASQSLAKETAKDIQNEWNAANGKVMIDGEEYNVHFFIDGKYNSGLTATEVAKNVDINNNYIRVESKGYEGKDISEMDELGGNTGVYLIENVSGKGTTTEAHEYGHNLGLKHPEVNVTVYDQDYNRSVGTYTGDDEVNIMYARGTYVTDDNSRKGAGNYFKFLGVILRDKNTNTLNPEKRKVTQKNIDDLGLDKLNYDKNGKASLGHLSNKHHK